MISGHIRSLASSLRKRSVATHKGDYGHVLVIAGSRGLSGAACLSSMAALRSGSGLVTLAVPHSVVGSVSAQLTEVMVLPLPETSEGSLAHTAVEQLISDYSRFDVCVLGPGISQVIETTSFARDIIKHLPLPMIIDADGLNACAASKECLIGRSMPTVLTPHPGEMGRLCALSTSDVQQKRVECAQVFARDNGVIVVLKGAGTVIADTNGEYAVNTTGNPGMATAGSGDVLSGMIASFLGQHIEPFQAAQLGAFVHGYAGDLAARELGQHGLIARDIIGKVPLALKRILG